MSDGNQSEHVNQCETVVRELECNTRTEENDGTAIFNKEFLLASSYDETKLTSCQQICTKEKDSVSKNVLQENRYFVHSFLLSIHSQFFRSLFARSGMKETKQEEIEINIQENESKVFKTLLISMYNQNVLDNFSISEIQIITEIADRYCCDFVTERCLCLMNELLNEDISSLNECMKVVCRLDGRGRFQKNVNKLREQCRKKLFKSFNPLGSKNPDSQVCFIRLNQLTLKEVFHLQELEVDSENSVLSCIIIWATRNNPSALELEELLHLVDAENLSSNYLNDVITSHHPLLSFVPSYNEWFADALRYHSFPKMRRLSTKSETLIGRVYSTRCESFVVKLKERQNDGMENLMQIYEFSDETLLCKGYLINFTIFFAKDRNISMKLSVPNILGVNNEIFFRADFSVSLHSGNLSERDVKVPLFFVKKNVLFTEIEQFEELIHLKRVSVERMQEGFSSGFYAMFRINIH